MKQKEDVKTIDLVDQPGVVRQRGRPVVLVLSKQEQAAQRKRRSRAKLDARGKGTFSVTLPLDVIEAVREFLRFKDESQDQLIERVLRDRLMRKR